MGQTVAVTFPAPAPPAPSAVATPWSRAIAVTLTTFVLVGLAAGWAWQQYATLARYRADETGAALDEEEMTRVFGPDGLFVSIGFVTALVVGGLLFWWLRNNGPFAVAVVVLGAVAGSGAAWGLGMLLGHDPLDPRLQAAKPGDLIAAPLELHGWTALAGWPVGAALAAALVAALTWRQEPTTVDHDPAEQFPGMHQP